MEILEEVLGGVYETRKLSASDVEQICTSIVSIVKRDEDGDQDFVHRWPKVPRVLTPDGLYIHMVASCATYLLEHINPDVETVVKQGAYKLVIDIFDFVDEQMGDFLNNGSIDYNKRKADAYQSLGNYNLAITLYTQEYRKISLAISSNTGKSLPDPYQERNKFALVEEIFAEVGRCAAILGDQELAIHCVDTVLTSVRKRGHADLITERFPEGIASMLDNPGKK